MDGEHVPVRVRRSGGSARFDDHVNASGELGIAVREFGVRSAVGAPIIVVGRLWGTLERLPPAVEATAYFVFAEALTNVAKPTELRSSRVSRRAG